jgi:hypothetical protein
VPPVNVISTKTTALMPMKIYVKRGFTIGSGARAGVGSGRE